MRRTLHFSSVVFFPKPIEAPWSPIPVCQHGWMSALFWAAGLLSYPHMVEGARELSGISFTRALILTMRALPSRPSHLPKTSLPNITTMGVKISTCEVWGDTNIQIIAAKLSDILQNIWLVLLKTVKVLNRKDGETHSPGEPKEIWLLNALNALDGILELKEDICEKTRVFSFL